MSLKITSNSSTDSIFISPTGVAPARDRNTEASTARELTNLAAMPAIAAVGVAISSAAEAISPSRVEMSIPLKFQLLSRKLLELGYCDFETPKSLRYILRNILKQLGAVTIVAETKKFLKKFSKNIGLPPDKRSLTDRQLAEAIQKFVSTAEIMAHFDCSPIHFNQREHIKTTLIKGAELLAQLVSYWDDPIEDALKEHLPEKDALKVVAHLLKERGMLTGYITNLGEKVAQKLSDFAAGMSLKNQDHGIILQLIVDVLLDEPDIEFHESQLSMKHQGPIRTILEPYHAAKKIKNGPHILGPSIDIYFYKVLINTNPLKKSNLQPEGHNPTLLHAFLVRCKEVNDQLDIFEKRVGLNIRHLAEERAASSVEEEGLRKLTGKVLQKQVEKEVRKVDESASDITEIFHHMNILKNINVRLQDLITRHTSVDLSFIRTSFHLVNRAKKEIIEIHYLLTQQAHKNLQYHESLNDTDLILQEPLSDASNFLSLLSTPLMNYGASPPQHLVSIEIKMQFRRIILEGKRTSDISKLLRTLEKNIEFLNNLRIQTESVIHLSKALAYLLGSDIEQLEEALAQESAAYEKRFATLPDQIDPPGAKIPLLFRTAERTFISTPPRPSSSTDRTITPSPPLLDAAGAVISSPTLREHSPSERLFAEDSLPIPSAKSLAYEDLPIAVEPPPTFSSGPTGVAGSIPCLLTQMLMIRPSTAGKGSALREESTSHILLAGQDMEQLIKAIQNRDLPLFRAASYLLMIDTHVAIEQHLKALLVGTATDFTDHSLVSLQAMLGSDPPSEFHSLFEESDLSIMWARYPEKALQVHGHKRKKPPLIHCIERLSSLMGLESPRDQAFADAILFQLKRILTQAAALVLGPKVTSPLEALLAAPVGSYIPVPPRKKNAVDIEIDAVKQILLELCERSDLEQVSLTSLKEVTHYLDWIEAAENMLQFDLHKSSSYWVMRLFIGGVDKLFENLYIGAASAHGIGEIRSHNLLSLRNRLFSPSVKSTLSEEEVDHIAGFNIGNGLQYPHQQQNARSDILLKALNYSLSHIGVEEGFSPARAQMMSDWELTLEAQVQIALSIWVKEARSLFPREDGAKGCASAAENGPS